MPILINVLIKPSNNTDKLEITTFINSDDETADEIVMANSLIEAIRQEIDLVTNMEEQHPYSDG